MELAPEPLSTESFHQQPVEGGGPTIEQKALGVPFQVTVSTSSEGFRCRNCQPTRDGPGSAGIMDDDPVRTSQQARSATVQADHRNSLCASLSDDQRGVVVEAREQQDVRFGQSLQHLPARNPAQPCHALVDAEAARELT